MAHRIALSEAQEYLVCAKEKPKDRQPKLPLGCLSTATAEAKNPDGQGLVIAIPAGMSKEGRLAESENLYSLIKDLKTKQYNIVFN